MGATQSWQKGVARLGYDWEEPVAAKLRVAASRKSDRALNRRQGQVLAWLQRCELVLSLRAV